MSHTPGPWRWEYNAESKSVHLVGGRPQFDKTVMQFARWGMSGATPLFNSKITGDQYNVMERVCDRPDWIAPAPGREHHAHWFQLLTHPDAVLIQAAPEILAMLKDTLQCLEAHLNEKAISEGEPVRTMCPCWTETVEPAKVLIKRVEAA